ncbi:MAG: hypothetical protein V3T16_02145, partial [Gemmatimonadales bacterium]
AVPLYHLMEDVATAEISRTQVWQWAHHGVTLSDGRMVTPELVISMIAEELLVIAGEVGVDRIREGRFAEASALFRDLCTATTLAPFLTIPAYGILEA